MKRGKDFRREFPNADESFERAIQTGLEHLPYRGRGWTVNMRIAIAMMTALLLLTSVGVAEIIERLGISEFIQRTGVANLSEEAVGIVGKDFEDQVLDTSYGTVTVTAAVYDGMAVYLLMEVEPNIDSCMVIPSAPFEGNQAWSFGRDYPKDQSIEAYAEAQGYKKLLTFQAMSSETTAHFYDSQTNKDGTFSIMMWSYVRPEYRLQDELAMNLWITVYNATGDGIGEFETELTIPLAGEVQCASSVTEEPVAVESAGIAVYNVETVTTPMATYILVHCDVTDSVLFKAYRMYAELDFLDEHGETIPKGAQPLSLWVYASRQQMGDGTYYITNRLFVGKPAQITIAFQDGSLESGWTDGKTWMFQLQ